MRTRAERLSALAIALVVMALGLVSSATSANAAPYATQRTLFVSVQTPTVGATITVTGEGYSANVDVRIELHSQLYTLGYAHTSSTGEFSTRVMLPEGVTGSHTLAAVEVVSGLTATAGITILGPPVGGSPPPAQNGVTVNQQQSVSNVVKQSVISSTKQSAITSTKQSASAPQSVSSAQELPRTGASVVGLIVSAVALLIVGGLLILFAGRRRKTTVIA